MSKETGAAESTGGRTRSHVWRGVIGPLIGAVAGALLGVLLVVFISGWGDYTRSLGDDRTAGIVGANGTEAGFTRLVTFVFAFWGAVICGSLGLLTGFLTGFWKSGAGRTSPKAIRADKLFFKSFRIIEIR